MIARTLHDKISSRKQKKKFFLSVYWKSKLQYFKNHSIWKAKMFENKNRKNDENKEMILSSDRLFVTGTKELHNYYARYCGRNHNALFII